jgi:signal transduction histidine kinase
MIGRRQPTAAIFREPVRSAPRGLAFFSRGLGAFDLRDTLRPTLWVLFGLLLTDVYLFIALAAPPGYVAPIPLFLPQAVTLSALLLTPPRRWWLLLAVYYVYLVVHGILRSNPPLFMALSEVADLIGAFVGAALVLRFAPRATSFTTLRSISIFAACVAVACALSASWGTMARVLIGSVSWDAWSRWFLSVVLASLIVAPMIILWARAGRAGLRVASRARLVEVAALTLGVLLLAGLRAENLGGPDVEQTMQRFLPIPLLVWAALRFGPRGLMTALSLVLVLSIAVVSNPGGSSPAANTFNAQIFLLAVGVPLFGLAVLVQERQRTQAALQRSAERYRAVVTSLPLGAVLLFRADLRHRFADGQGLPELGLDTGTVPGKTLHQVFPAPLAASLEPHYQAALAGAHESFDLTHEGRTYHAEVLPVAFTNRPTGMLLLQDVTEARRAQALAVTNVELERLSNAKSEFVSVVSHEFRTPLTSIQAFSELLRDEEFPDGQRREFAADINREAERLNRMITELLDLERMESGQMALHREPLDVNALIRGAAATIPLQGPLHPVRFELDPALPPLWGDGDKLTQVVLNLLSNAMKYSPEGGEVAIGARGEAGLAHLWVRDQGIGIPASELETIFDRYTRLASGYDVSITGTGLGLPIVRQIAELHGGRAWAESEPGHGSTFHVTLPLGNLAAPR